MDKGKQLSDQNSSGTSLKMVSRHLLEKDIGERERGGERLLLRGGMIAV